MILRSLLACLGIGSLVLCAAQARLPRRDAAVEAIMVPSDDPRYAGMNPAVQEPRIILRNNGSDPLAAISIRYGTKGFLPRMFAWTGHLGSGTSTEVLLPHLIDMRAGTNTFTVKLGDPNGRRDAREADNTLSTTFTAAPLLGSPLTVRWRVPAGVGGRLYLESTRGPVPLERSWNAGPDTVLSETVELVPGSYFLHVADSGRAAHTSVRVFGTDADLITVLRPKDRKGSRYQFRVEENAGAPPGPASDAELVMLPGRGMALADVFTEEKALLVVTDGNGEPVVEWHVPEKKEMRYSIDLSAKPAGSYGIELISQRMQRTHLGRIDLFDGGPR